MRHNRAKKDCINKTAFIPVLMIMTACLTGMNVHAADLGSLDVSVEAPSASADVTDSGRSVVVFGADLNDTERAEVLKKLDLTEEGLKDYDTDTVTNEEEHKYLDAYIDPATIGSRALTSVRLTLKPEGSGITVKTGNISYCTEGMFRNALITAGVQDAEICVVSPSEASGTAGIIGAVKAYSKAAGTEISDQAVETAVSEAVTTGRIEDDQKEDLQRADAEAMMIWLKTQMADDKTDTDSGGVSGLINTGIQKFGVDLNSGDRQLLTDLMGRWENLGLNSEYIKQQADRLYGLYGKDVLEKANRDIDSKVKKSAGHLIQGIFEGMGEAVGTFFRDLFGNI
jgi:uncharacterized protein YpuA (DUF1002 family)